MDAMTGDGFAVAVGRPRSYQGDAELRVTPGSVTLVARPIRHFRVVFWSFIAVAVVVTVIAGVFSGSGQMALRDPGLTAQERSAADRMSYGAPMAAGVLIALLGVGMALTGRALRGDPRSMDVPLASVSLAKGKGRMLVLSAAFDTERPASWTLFARSGEEAEAIRTALTAGDG